VISGTNGPESRHWLLVSDRSFQKERINVTDVNYQQRSALVTGANSGLGFEAARQLAELGYGSVVLACRTEAKGEAARAELVAATGVDPFSTIEVDVAEIQSSQAAAAELIRRGDGFDAVLLNAGMVPNSLERTSDGIEMCFAASLIGHHIIATALLEQGLVNDGGAIVLVGSEAANDDLPKAMGMSVYDFVRGEPSEFGSTPTEAMESFARAENGPAYDGNRQYSTTKAFSAWWSAAMARRHPGGVSFYTVSPGANMGTNAGRHATGFFKLMIGFMRRFGRYVGMDQPIDKGAGRYLDALHGNNGTFRNGGTYTSRPKKMTGPLVESTAPHLLVTERQDTALAVLDKLSHQHSEAS
jgi:NAD(P)-dependent dehydrogenase (short-subunit alcohol dehydrogenase family)